MTNTALQQRNTMTVYLCIVQLGIRYRNWLEWYKHFNSKLTVGDQWRTDSTLGLH